VVEELDRRPLEHRCDAMSAARSTNDACHGNVIGRMLQSLASSRSALTSWPPSSGQARVTSS
jgi:hypothetical protein